MTTAPGAASITERRAAFINHLYGLHHALSSPIPQRVSDARRILARLRRSITGPRQQAEAYDVVFAFDPPMSEQDTWLLVAGLFAVNPQPRSRTAGPRTLGASMRRLTELRGSSADRRFIQLLSVERTALPHYLRQTVRLLSTENVPLDYRQLLDDLVTLLDARRSEDEAHRVRLNWARDFHRRATTTRTTPTATDESESDTLSGDPQ
ncbi:type I-E CRISPR-associated protein Cse2/CasB [Kibdelosporangium aridum]|uniref:type I-E CRISPR-associated protein Cse2/CasB n=1 Tax=Kibdelosporangium aridum TaxID=2030 RepID=UPI0035EDA999